MRPSEASSQIPAREANYVTIFDYQISDPEPFLPQKARLGQSVDRRICSVPRASAVHCGCSRVTRFKCLIKNRFSDLDFSSCSASLLTHGIKEQVTLSSLLRGSQM